MGGRPAELCCGSAGQHVGRGFNRTGAGGLVLVPTHGYPPSAWTPCADPNFEDFSSRLPALLNRLNVLGLQYRNIWPL